MQGYDVTLKQILKRPGTVFLRSLTGQDSLRWLTEEKPVVRNPRVDLLGETEGGELIHIEIQSQNHRRFGFRMAEYLFAIERQHGRAPRQIAIYVGEPPLRMSDHVAGANFRVQFEVIDIRDLDGSELLASRNLSDNVIAILTRLGEQPGTLREVLGRIQAGPEADRNEAFAELAVLAGLRGLRKALKKEARTMRTLGDFLIHNEVFAPAVNKVRRESRKEGRAEGRVEGRTEGQLEIISALIERRFGRVSPTVRRQLADLTPRRLRNVGLRILKADTVNDLFVGPR